MMLRNSPMTRRGPRWVATFSVGMALTVSFACNYDDRSGKPSPCSVGEYSWQPPERSCVIRRICTTRTDMVVKCDSVTFECECNDPHGKIVHFEGWCTDPEASSNACDDDP